MTGSAGGEVLHAEERFGQRTPEVTRQPATIAQVGRHEQEPALFYEDAYDDNDGLPHIANYFHPPNRRVRRELTDLPVAEFSTTTQRPPSLHELDAQLVVDIGAESVINLLRPKDHPGEIDHLRSILFQRAMVGDSLWQVRTQAANYLLAMQYDADMEAAASSSPPDDVS